MAGILRVLSNSSAALRGFIHLNEALSSGSLPAEIRDGIASTVEAIHVCEYSVGSLTGLARTESDMAHGEGKCAAILHLVAALMTGRSRVEDSTIQSARRAGISDGEIVEVVANIALALLASHVGQIARTVIECPVAIPGAISDEVLHNALFSAGRSQLL